MMYGKEDQDAYEYNDGRLPDGSQFRDPGGRSALRAGRRIYPCPTCGRPKKLTERDKQLGYQCNACADRAEGGGF